MPVLERLLEEKRFDRPKNLMGLEIELNLAGPDGMPCMMNAEVLDRIASRDFQTELGMFNLEVNIAPHRLGGRVFDRLAEELRTGLGYAHRKASEVDAGIVMIGILPTLDRSRTWSPQTFPTSTAIRCSTTRCMPPAARISLSILKGSSD